MKEILIKNATLVLPNGVFSNRSVLIRGEQIVDINYTKSPSNEAEVIDLSGQYLMAGFIDIHAHGGGNADFMDATPEAFYKIASTHLKHGTTTMLATAMSATNEELKDFIRAYKLYENNVSLHKDCAEILGLHLEGPYFSTKGAKGAQPSQVFREPTNEEMEQLIHLADGKIVRWDADPDVDNMELFAEKMKEYNILSSVAHSSADSERTEEAFKNGFSHTTHFYNAMTTYHKKDQSVLAGVVEAAYLNNNVTIELIGDGCHIPRDILRLAMKIKGVERICCVTDATRLAGTNLTEGFLGSARNGTPVIVDQNVAKLPDMSAFAGSIATMDRVLHVLCNLYGVSLSDATMMMSYTPAKRLGIQNLYGSIDVNKYANLVVLNSKLEVTAVMLKGIYMIQEEVEK